MQRYRNLDGHSGVDAYETGAGFIRVCFVNGETYEYTELATGRAHVGHMQELAAAGRGLASYINRFVHDDYARKR